MANIQQRLERELKRREEIHELLAKIDESVIPLKKPYLREQYLVNRRIANLSYLLRKEQGIK